MERCWVCDVEGDLPNELTTERYDALLFSHVLEHLRDPAMVLARLTKFVKMEGVVLISVPNVLSWRQRIDFLPGRFECQSAGVLDDTHLHFFTYHTVDR